MDQQGVCSITHQSRTEIGDRRVYEVDSERNIFYDVVALGMWIKRQKRHGIKPCFPHNRENISPNQINDILEKAELVDIIYLRRPPGKPIFEQSGCIHYTSPDQSLLIKCYGNGYIITKMNGYILYNHHNFNPWQHDTIMLKRIPTFGEWSQSR